MSNITICMITKNEAELLPRALADWRQLADSLIVVDTGSTDATVAIAEQHGAQVVHYDWQYPGHKGAARNTAIDAAQDGWIVVLDADEVIQDPVALRHFISDTQLDCIDVQFQNYDEAGQVILQWMQPRIFRRHLYRYKHREHEMPLPVNGATPRTGWCNAIFEHRPPANRAPGKVRPMLDRLMADCREYPDDPHPIYFLHRQLMHAREWREAILCGETYLGMTDGGAYDQCECFGNLAYCYERTGETQQAINHLHQALAAQPQRRSWWIRLAETYYNAHQFGIALAWLRGATELPPETGQHARPGYTGQYLYELMQRCQTAIATGEHHHG